MHQEGSTPIRWHLGLWPLILLVASAQAQIPRRQLTTESIARQAIPATVVIVAMDGSGDTLGFGSGFLVESNGTIVTNYHVMLGASRAVIVLSTGESYDRVVGLDADSVADIAIIKIPGFGLQFVTPNATLPPVGSRLIVVGNPLGLDHTVTEGIVSAVRLVQGRQLLQMSVPISPGSSGGPVFNQQGEVVAIAVSYLDGGQNLNFAVPVRYAMGLLESTHREIPLSEMFGGTRRTERPNAPTPFDSAMKILAGYSSRGQIDSMNALVYRILAMDTTSVQPALLVASDFYRLERMQDALPLMQIVAERGTPVDRENVATMLVNSAFKGLQLKETRGPAALARSALVLAPKTSKVWLNANYALGLATVLHIATVDPQVQRLKSCEMARQQDALGTESANALVLGREVNTTQVDQYLRYLEGMRPRIAAMIRSYCH